MVTAVLGILIVLRVRTTEAFLTPVEIGCGFVGFILGIAATILGKSARESG